MDLREQEIRGGYKWLLVAGTAAILLSASLFYADDVIMGHAKDRDHAHAAQMRELRMAQSSLPSNVTDHRQTLSATLDAEQDADPHAGH